MDVEDDAGDREQLHPTPETQHPDHTQAGEADEAERPTPEKPEKPEKPELVIGLVGPVGTDLHGLATAIEEKMAAFKYRCEKIRVSTLIKAMCEPDLLTHIAEAKGSGPTQLLMDAGDHIRRKTDKGDALVPLVVAAIRAARVEIKKSRSASEGEHAGAICYVIDSLKHPDEIATLRGIYGRSFVLISAFDTVDSRTARLQRRIAKSNVSTELEKYHQEAVDLITTDSKRPGRGIGQNVQDSFPLGDFLHPSGRWIRVRIGSLPRSYVRQPLPNAAAFRILHVRGSRRLAAFGGSF